VLYKSTVKSPLSFKPNTVCKFYATVGKQSEASVLSARGGTGYLLAPGCVSKEVTDRTSFRL